MNQSWVFLKSFFNQKGPIHNESFQKIIKNIGWLFFDRLFRMGISLFVGSWLARYLGPSQYGMYNYAIAFVAILAPFSTLGLDSIVIREIINHPTQQDRLINTTVIAKLASGLFTLLIVFSWIFYLNPYDIVLENLILISGISILIKPFDAIDFYFQSITSSKFTIYAKSTAFLCANTLKIILIKLGSSLQGLMLTDIVESFIGGIGLCVLYRQKGHKLHFSGFDKNILHKLLLDSWPLIISSSLIMIYMRIDQIMIGNLLGNHETGIYAAAVKIAEISYFLPMAIVSSTFPKILEKKIHNEQEFKNGLQKLYKILSALSYIISFFLTAFSSIIISKIYGPNYIGANSSLIILSWSCMWVSLGVARSSFLTAINRNILHLKSIAIATVINVILNYILIPRIGIIGAGIATNISYFFAAYFSCFVYQDLRETGKMMTKALLLSKA